MGWRFRFHNVHVPYAESLNDEAIDTNAEVILKRVLDEHAREAC